MACKMALQLLSGPRVADADEGLVPRGRARDVPRIARDTHELRLLPHRPLAVEHDLVLGRRTFLF